MGGSSSGHFVVVIITWPVSGERSTVIVRMCGLIRPADGSRIVTPSKTICQVSCPCSSSDRPGTVWSPRVMRDALARIAGPNSPIVC